MIEMLAYSRPGVVEVLPALPPSLVKGSINGMLLRTFARLDKLSWDMEARTVDLTITSVRKQDVTLIARHGIEAVSASPGALAAKPQSRHGRLRPALAGRKTGGGSFEARTAQPVGLGQLGRLNLAENDGPRRGNYEAQRFSEVKRGHCRLVGSLEVSPTLAAAESDPRKTSEPAGAPAADNRPAEYLHRVRGDSFLPKPPVPARSYPISPMSLAERVRRKIVPRRGFCSIAPGELVSESLTSGNGTMTIELMGDPYSEQILFHHESLLMPWKRPLEAPQVADIFPQVRQMVLAGKDREAMTLALQHMNDSPIKQDTEPHLTVPAFLMQLDLPKTAALRTISVLSISRRERRRFTGATNAATGFVRLSPPGPTTSWCSGSLRPRASR